MTGTAFPSSKVSILLWRTYIQHYPDGAMAMYLPCNQIVKVPQPLPSYPSSYSPRHANCYSPPRRFGQCAWPSNCTSAAVLASAARFVGSRTTHLDMTCPAYRYRTGYCICRLGSALGRESSTRSANSHLDSRFSIRFLSISRV